MIDRVCEYCGKTFQTYPSLVKNGGGKFCSRACKNHSQIGRHRNYVEKICQYCGKHFTIPAWKVRQGGGKFCSPQCSNLAQVGKHPSPETLKKISLAHKRQWEDPDQAMKISAKISKASKERWQNPEYKLRLSESHKRNWGNPEYARRMSEARKKTWQDPLFVAKMSQIRKKLWQDPKFRKRMVSKIIASLQKKPTKPEQKLIAILKKYLPQFRYNGDFSLGITVGGLVPDFVNVNGRKEVIEVFGDYFHSPEVLGDRWQGSELGKIAIYNSVGYKCLVIWGSELNELADDEVVNKVNTFFSKKRIRR